MYYPFIMPIKDSAKKELRKANTRAAFNTRRKKAIKELIKKIRKQAASGQTEEVKKMLPQAARLLDKAAKKKIIHSNKANRVKSRLQKLLNKAAK